MRLDESNTEDDVITFRVEDSDGYIYTGTKTTTSTLPVNGKYYAATVSLTKTGEQSTFKITPAENYEKESNRYVINGNVTLSGATNLGNAQIQVWKENLSLTLDNVALEGKEDGNAMLTTWGNDNLTFTLKGKNTFKNVMFDIYKSDKLTFKGTGSLEGFTIYDDDLDLFKKGTKTYTIDASTTKTCTLTYEDGLKFFDNGDGTYSIKKSE